MGDCHFGVMICYEDTDPYLARQYVRGDRGQPLVDFLLNISNDGWFDGTCEHDEHLAICRFRAIESRRPVARAVNMGISAIIDGNGRVLQARESKSAGVLGNARLWEVDWSPGVLPEMPCSEWSRFKKVPAVVIGSIPLDRRASLYAQWGDWLPQACWAVFGAGLVWSLLRRRWSTPAALGSS
jgi:apolipoprotein N-acyltransferase